MNMINRLGEAREKLGYSQEQLARITGIKQQAISEYELGNRIPSGINMLKLARALHCYVDELFILEKGD